MSNQSKVYVKNHLPIEIKAKKIFISNTLIVLMSAFIEERNSYLLLILLAYSVDFLTNCEMFNLKTKIYYFFSSSTQSRVKYSM